VRFLRSLAAIAIGLAFMRATTLVWGIVSGAALSPGRAYLALNFFVCGMGGLVGGWLTARVAPSSPYAHAAALAALVALISIPAATGAPSASYPGWYPGAIGLIAVLGVLLGGKLRAAAASGDGAVAA
jgi:hypothetical protein